ncbi:MAG: hypothetical protein MUO75_00940, partial [Actinobacteria bacterium]|nr:hypothetical protein [Actinomycetota bacterium]
MNGRTSGNNDDVEGILAVIGAGCRGITLAALEAASSPARPDARARPRWAEQWATSLGLKPGMGVA